MKILTTDEAKNAFPKVLKLSQKDIVIVTNRGKPVAAIQSPVENEVDLLNSRLDLLPRSFSGWVVHLNAPARRYDPYVETQQREAAVVLWSYMNLESFARRIRDACIDAALHAYEDAGVQGLCAEGRWEVAVSALRTVDLRPVLRDFQQSISDR